MRFFLRLLPGIAFAIAAVALPLPYDEAANARLALESGLREAHNENKNVLVIFGANWCEDCRDLDQAMRASSAPLIRSRFVVVKIDVGNFNKNLELANQYGNPIQKGIPAAVVLTSSNQVLYSTKAGELADARRMGERGIYEFFSRILSAHAPS